MKYTGFNPELEKLHRQETDHIFGAASKDCIALIPVSDRDIYLPIGEIQAGRQDTADCASRAPVNILEAKFTYLYQNNKLHSDNQAWLQDNGYIVNGRVVFSDRFIAIKSKTTREGNSMIAPLDAIHRYGLIPKPMFPLEDWMMWEDYTDETKITKEMDDLGLEFLRRFDIKYERVSNDNFPIALQKDLLCIGVHAWPIPDNGVYHRTEEDFNHECVAYKLPKYQIYDNYLDENRPNDFTKTLAADFRFFDSGYRVYIAAEIPPEKRAIQLSVLDILTKYGLLAFFASFWESFSRGGFGGLRSPQWRDLRNEFLRENPRCAVCGSEGKLLNGISVHHVVPFHEDKSKELDPQNLITLCRVHHFWFGHLGSWRSWNKDVREDAAKFLYKIVNRP